MDMNNKLIKLTESDLHRIVKESVNRIISEIGDTPKGQYMLGQLAQRNGEQRPVQGRFGKMRKDKDNNPIFNYAEKSAKKNGMGLDDYQRGIDHKRALDVLNDPNASSDEKKSAVAHSRMKALFRNGFRKSPFYGSKPIDQNTTDDELRDMLGQEDQFYFPR